MVRVICGTVLSGVHETLDIYDVFMKPIGVKALPSSHKQTARIRRERGMKSYTFKKGNK